MNWKERYPERSEDEMTVRKKLIKALFLTLVTVILGVSSVAEADKRHRTVH